MLFVASSLLMLWRLEGGSHAVSAVTIASLAASPVLLSFDLAIFGIAALLIPLAIIWWFGFHNGG